jgi:hypothetical protein
LQTVGVSSGPEETAADVGRYGPGESGDVLAQSTVGDAGG